MRLVEKWFHLLDIASFAFHECYFLLLRVCFSWLERVGSKPALLLQEVRASAPNVLLNYCIGSTV